MITFNIEDHFPLFLLNDKNGYAMAKALEAGINAFFYVINQGVDCIADYDTMPEWRLDELAWETNCLYDQTAPIGKKREWIKNAMPIYRQYGTASAIRYYLSGFFDDVVVEENVDGHLFHFRVSLTLNDEWTPEKELFIRRIIETAKNARSVLDGIIMGTRGDLGIHTIEEGTFQVDFPMTSEELFTGTVPNDWVV